MALAMRVLYIGQLRPGSTSLARMTCLQRLGLECHPFDVTPFYRMGNRVERSLLARFQIGRGVRALNAQLLRGTHSNAFDIVWIDKGVLIYPETLSVLRSRAAHRFAVHYTPDPQLVHHKSRHFRACIPIYDLAVTTKTFEIDLYKVHGVRDLLLVQQGYGERFAQAAEARTADNGFSYDVCFIGHCEEHYAARLRAATSAAPAAVWGPGWTRYARRHDWIRPHVKGDGIWGDEYPQALMRSRIALGLLSKQIPETTTTRTFEIPATATFMLAERTADHLALFEEGIEVEFFSSDEEMRDKIRFYIANEAARTTIARAGRQRCLTSGYSDTAQLQRVVDRISAHLGAT